ncbi:hypothetical protein GBF38_010698 [Nibea albiflora]|uniref:Uncharacterized protein n=1 Tax=Nibea albiflora TaxID=240163 RepID=A0ACB7EVQ4_NIBAL|nr:hypothetical protein GBF38_010698 [Nibea albiflora]
MGSLDSRSQWLKAREESREGDRTGRTRRKSGGKAEKWKSGSGGKREKEDGCLQVRGVNPHLGSHMMPLQKTDRQTDRQGEEGRETELRAVQAKQSLTIWDERSQSADSCAAEEELRGEEEEEEEEEEEKEEEEEEEEEVSWTAKKSSEAFKCIKRLSYN